MVELVNVSKKYRDKIILKNINYTFSDTGIYLLKGESGCGKTTLLKIISNRLEHEGEVKGNNDIFFLPFNDYLINEFRVCEMIQLEKEIYTNFKVIKEDLNIDILMNRKVSSLSLGEKQRVGIYLALCSNCKIVLLDEPLAGLDKSYRKKVINAIKRESKKRLFIVVSHDFNISENEIELTINNGNLIGESLIVNTRKKENFNKQGTVSFKWGLLLHFKQIFSRLIFIISCIGIVSFTSLIKEEINVLRSDLSGSFSSEYIYYKSNNMKLNDDIFYDVVVSSISKEVNSYFIYTYSEEMYDARISINDYYLGNGFLFSNSMYIEGLNQDEVIVEINKNEFCVNNKLFYCGDEMIKENMLGSNLVYSYNNDKICLKIKDVIIGNSNMIYLSDLGFVNNELKSIHGYSNIYSKYMILVDDNKLESFYDKLATIPRLQYYDFILVYSDSDYSSFLVETSDNSYFHLEELESNSFIACSDIGYSCNVFEFSKFKSLAYINSYNIENKIYYKKINRSLTFNEVIISSGLKEYLGCDIGDIINLNFYFDDEYHLLDNVKIVEVVQDDTLTIYHSDYDYKLFRERFNKNLRVEYVYSSEKLDNYKRSNALYYEMVKEIEDYINKMVEVINIVVNIFATFMIGIMFIIEGSKLKRHGEYFCLLHHSKVKYKHIFNIYMSFYLLCSLIYLNNLMLFLIYLGCFSVFYKLESKKIRSIIGP